MKLLKMFGVGRLQVATSPAVCVVSYHVASQREDGSRRVPSAYTAPDFGIIKNPAIPHSLSSHGVLGTGASRKYLTSHPPTFLGYPPRTPVAAIADLDRIMSHCDYAAGKVRALCDVLVLADSLTSPQLVRDCLEVLRTGANLDGPITRRSIPETWKHMYVLEQPQPPVDVCAGEHIFHMFWAGAFTDKPYMAVLSFLFTQDLKLHLPPGHASSCLPQMWVWIHRGPTKSTDRQLFEDLRSNPWSAPFLHERFKKIIHFRRWSTAEQLNTLHEFSNTRKTVVDSDSPDGFTITEGRWDYDDHDIDDMMSDSSPTSDLPSTTAYDRGSVGLSDMARFVLCHRFGGVYLDADIILLRDWAELFHSPSAFAYRWSRLDVYNTAVLRLRRQSALGSFILRCALSNGFDFHPMAVSRYLKDAGLGPLLAMLPDALFDPAWLNVCCFDIDLTSTNHLNQTEYLQRDRAPFPYFKAYAIIVTDSTVQLKAPYSFGDFFHPNPAYEPQVLGTSAFFRGAYAYHYHNYWYVSCLVLARWLTKATYRWRPLDPTRDWPDLGGRFAGVKLRASPNSTNCTEEDAFIDLSWATVHKRTFEAYIRGERPNMYGEWLHW
jgi:WD repeat and SOF domain-containing protein 1